MRFSPSFGSSPVNLALANPNAAMVALAGPSHNFAAKGSINKRHTSGLVGPLDHDADRGKNLIDQLSAVNGDVYVSIVPFAKDLNAGASNYAQSWVR